MRDFFRGMFLAAIVAVVIMAFVVSDYIAAGLGVILLAYVTAYYSQEESLQEFLDLSKESVRVLQCVQKELSNRKNEIIALKDRLNKANGEIIFHRKIQAKAAMEANARAVAVVTAKPKVKVRAK